MDELDNDALSLLLILDDELFPQLLEWTASKGWSDLVIFLLETDYFRFKTNDLFEELEVTKPSLYEAYYLIEKNSGGCFDKFFTEEQLTSLKRLLDSGIPLNTVYSYTCSMVWKEMLVRVKEIIDSPFWPSVRRSIVDKHEITLEEMLEDSSKRVFFDRYIQGEANDLSTLQCLLSIRRILKAVNRFKLSTDGTIASLPSTPVVLGMIPPHGTNSSASHFFSYFTGQHSDDNSSSLMRRWRVSKNAVSSASKALQAPFATSTSTSNHTNTHSTTTTSPQQPSHDYSDPFEVFRILLEGTRQLQKQFFPNSTSVLLSSATNSAFVTYSGGNAAVTTTHNANRARRYSGTDTGSDAGSVASSPGKSNNNDRSHHQHTHHAHQHSHHHHQQQQYYNGQQNNPTQRNCSGISEALRIEIQSTLTINASVRTRDIETVDRAFAFACSNMFENLLLALETEMLTYIQNIFNDFVSTTTYAMMVAHARALQCKRVVDYAAKLEFLYDRVRQQKVVSWKDSHTRGKVFLAYGKLSAEGDDDCSAALPYSPTRHPCNANTTATATSHTRHRAGSYTSTSGVEVMEGDLEDDQMATAAPYKPNIVAISLEIVLPHTTMLTPANVMNCSHRVCLYAGGKRRAARLRPTLKTPTPSSCALVPPRPITGSTRTLLPTLKEGIDHEDSYTSGVAPLADSLPALTTTLSPMSVPPAMETFATVSSLSTKSPIRRMTSVKFTFDEVQAIREEQREAVAPNPALPTATAPTVTDTTTNASINPNNQDQTTTPIISNNTKKLEESDSEVEDDAFSELPTKSIASSVQGRTILSTNEVGRGGNCFDDIVNADTGDVNNSLEEEQLRLELTSAVGIDDEDLSGSSSNNSDSSSDYEGVVRHVYSNTDLDQLIRNSPMAGDFDQESVLEDGARSASFVKSRSQRGSSRKLRSRAGSDVSAYTAASGVTSYTQQSSHSGSAGVYNTNTTSSSGGSMRRMAAIDLTRLDRTLQRVVLGGYVPAPGTAGQSRVASSSSGAYNKKVTTKQLIASLAVALAAVRDDEDQFGRKFGVAVEESFTFTSDTKGLGQLNDMLYSKQPGSVGRDQLAGYLKSYETAASVFRQNSMLDTTRPLYRVSVQIHSTVITPAEAIQLKLQLTALESGRSIPTTANVGNKPNPQDPQTPKGVSVSPRSIIMHSHVRIAVSYVLLSPQHTMLTTLEAAAGVACMSMLPPALGSCGSLDSTTECGGPENSAAVCDLRPFPRHLQYCDPFVEYSTRSGACLSADRGESLYELYLGTHPGYHRQSSTRTATSLPDRVEGDEKETAPPLCEPISRHIGLCDFSLSTMVATVSPRLILQILMLVLVDRPIMLISTSSTLLSQLQAALPRLIWPFRIEHTHVIRQILSPAELHHFVYRHDVPFVTETQQPVIREKKLNRKASSWREIITRIASNVGSTLKNVTGGAGNGSGSVSGESTMPVGMRSPRGSFSNPNRQRKSGSNNDLLSEVLRRTASGHISTATPTIPEEERKRNSPKHLHVDIPGYSGKLSEPASHSPYTRIVTPPSLQLPSQTPTSLPYEEGREYTEHGHVVDQFSCIVGVDANAFYTAAVELREELETMRIRGSGFTFIDIDSGLILNRHPDDFSSEDEDDIPPRPLPSRLSDCELFRTTDFGVLRSLLKSLTRVNEDLTDFAQSILHNTTATATTADGYDYRENNSVYNEDLDDVISINNENLENMLEVDHISQLITERIITTNAEIEQAFYVFWSELILRSIPYNLQYFPGPKVISCNIRGMLTELLYTVVASSVLYDMGEDYEDLLPTLGNHSRENSTGKRKNTSINTTTSNNNNSTNNKTIKERTFIEWNQLNQLPAIDIPHTVMHDRMRKMPFEEFLAIFIEQIANHGENNLCYAFYKEFIADGSVVFKNLLLRHSEILEKWRI